MLPDIPVIAATSLIPLIIAFVWFHPTFFGGERWAEAAGFAKDLSFSNIKPLKLVLSLVLNFFLAFSIYNIAVHHTGVFSLVGGDVEALKTGVGAAFLAEYGANHLSFGHGFFHGIFPGVIGFILPILGYNVIFERKSTRYLLVNLGYWTLTMGLMGGIICQWGTSPVS